MTDDEDPRFAEDELEFDLEVPLPENRLTCEACGYLSGPICYDPIYSCSVCKEALAVRPVPWLYVTPDCPLCNCSLSPQARMSVRRVGESQRRQCPRCHQWALRYDSFMETFPASQRLLPEPGRVVHGAILPCAVGSDGLDVKFPGNPNYFLRVVITPRPYQPAPLEACRFLVESTVRGSEDARDQLILRCLGPLTPEEAPLFSRESGRKS